MATTEMEESQFQPPIPHILKGERFPGLLFNWPERCQSCSSRQCEKARTLLLETCSYGFNYQKISGALTIAGFLSATSPVISPAKKKNLRLNKEVVISNAQINNLVEEFRAADIKEKAEISQGKAKFIREYGVSGGYKDDFFTQMRADIQKGLSFVHDYKQINAQISQNINVIIETNRKGSTLDEKVNSASHEEKAIYWSSKFLQEKLNVARFLIHPEWITAQSEQENFRFHGLLTKYFRIYQNMSASRGVELRLTGSSYKNLHANPEAVGVIPHTFLDNAIKYSSRGGKIEVFVSDQSDGIYLSTSSHGPKIDDDEVELIFLPFKRGRAAEVFEEEGAGFGLFIAQLVAEGIGTKIKVQQNPNRDRFGYKTEFSVLIPYG